MCVTYETDLIAFENLFASERALDARLTQTTLYTRIDAAKYPPIFNVRPLTVEFTYYCKNLRRIERLKVCWRPTFELGVVPAKK